MPKQEFRFLGNPYTPERLDWMGSEMAEELNVKKVVFNLDGGGVFIVEHDLIRKHHTSYFAEEFRP